MSSYSSTIKIAVFESKEKYTYQCIYTEKEASVSTMVRITEWLEITFVPRVDSESIVQEKVDRIRKELDQIYAEAAEKALKLREREKELLALSYDQSVQPVELADGIPF